MGFGAEGVAAVMGQLYLMLGLFVLMVAASTVFTFVARRVLVWTQIVFILMVPLWFDEKRTLFVIPVAAWFMVAWPRRRSSASSGKKSWHPLLAIFAPPVSVAVVVLVTVILLSLVSKIVGDEQADLGALRQRTRRVTQVVGEKSLALAESQPAWLHLRDQRADPWN